MFKYSSTVIYCALSSCQCQTVSVSSRQAAHYVLERSHWRPSRVIFLTVDEETRKDIFREAGIKEKCTGTALIK